jgi:hypothetical protein
VVDSFVSFSKMTATLLSSDFHSFSWVITINCIDALSYRMW